MRVVLSGQADDDQRTYPCRRLGFMVYEVVGASKRKVRMGDCVGKACNTHFIGGDGNLQGKEQWSCEVVASLGSSSWDCG
jgi:hypothetical protein